MANSEHKPIKQWYETEDFLKKGSPSYTQVNGYDAMRDGRTVYVNAINVICPQVEDAVYCLTGAVNDCAYARKCGTNETGNPNFHTNVYVISLSDESPDAQNIFDQILKNWHFNTNINVNNMCAYANDKNACKTALGGEKGIAELQTKLRRDARRISDVVFMQDALNDYYKVKGFYPTLKAGTYLENQTISKWPSWQETLGAELRITMPNDPLNSFYPFEQCPATNQACYCNGYDAQTCWDNKSRLFNGKRDVKAGLANENNFEYTVGTGANAVEKTANLTNALVYYYKSSSNGASYEFNASKWETPYIGGESVEKIQASHSASNVKPVIANIAAIKMSPNSEKIVEIQAYDYNTFTGKIIWAAPVLKGTNKNADKLCSALANEKAVAEKNVEDKQTALDAINNNANATEAEKNAANTELTNAINELAALNLEKCCIASVELLPNIQKADKLYEDKFISYRNLKITAGANVCNGKINLKVSDDGISNVANSAMESDLYAVNVAVNNQLPAFASGINTYSAKTIAGYPWEYSVKASDAEDKNLTYKILSEPSWLAFEGGGAQKNSADGVKIFGTPTATGVYNFFIETKDSKGGVALLAIALTVTNKNPVITDFPADAEKHINENLSYDVKASDADGHKLKYSIDCNPVINCESILSIDSDTGKITIPDNFTVSDYGEHNFTIAADDGYGGVASQSFILKITPFCGNSTVENWVAGGIAEQCETGGAIGGETCQTLGYNVGDVSCKNDCSIDTSQCKYVFSVSGNVKDYMTASNLSGATVEIKAGGEVIKNTLTDANGNYTLADIPESADYNVIVSKEGYSNGDSGTFNLTADKIIDFILSGAGLQGAARFQLTWESLPEDLDSHLKFGGIEIYYGNPIDDKGAYIPIDGASLDLDDQDGYGPENIRIETLTANMVYKYFIYDYTNKNNCGRGSFNGAKIEIYNSGGVKVKEYSSTHAGHCYWYVFDMDDSGRIIDKNIYQNDQP